MNALPTGRDGGASEGYADRKGALRWPIRLPGRELPGSDLSLSKLVERASMVALGRIETAGDARPVLSYSVLRITSAL